MANRRIVISINSGWNVVNFRAGLVRALVGAGYDVVALTPDDGHHATIAKLGARPVVIAIDGRGMSPVADGLLLIRYIAALRRERPAAYLGFTIKPNVYGGIACRLLGIPAIANVAGLGTAFLKRGWLNTLVRRLYSSGLRGAHRVFFQNSEDRARFVADGLIAANRTALLPGSGIDLARFSPPPPRAGQGTVFLMVARLLKAKGVAEYVAAARALRRRYPDLTFQILGIRDHSPGGVEAAMLEEWRAAGDIVLLDAVADVRPALAAADCVVLPSYYPEGTPRSLLEAAAMARPIVTTDTPGCRDVVDDGVNGFLCAPRDAEALTATLDRFIQLDSAARTAMGAASRAKAERQFDERLVIDAYLEALATAGEAGCRDAAHGL